MKKQPLTARDTWRRVWRETRLGFVCTVIVCFPKRYVNAAALAEYTRRKPRGPSLRLRLATWRFMRGAACQTRFFGGGLPTAQRVEASATLSP